jgi:hypothetical protein
MTLPKSEQTRPYLKHGHLALSKALKTIGNQDGWVDNLGDVGEALKAWKAAIIEDLGGESEVSAMELSVIELACKTHLLLASIDRFLLEQKSLINKSRRQLFPIVLQRQTLADALSAYMRQLGMKKKSRPPISLSDYLTNGKAKLSPDPTSPSAVDAQVHTPSDETTETGASEATT